MSTTQTSSEQTAEAQTAAAVAQKIEVVVIPVSDVDRAKQFYTSLGWRLDADFTNNDDWRIVQLTPPGSPCSVFLGKGLTNAAPGSVQGTFLVVDDVQQARAELAKRGVEVSDVFHFDHDLISVASTKGRLPGPDPQDRSYFSFATFSDPDGNSWLLQEITMRLHGRIDTGVTSFGSATDLAGALRRAEAAHGEHEKRTGVRDENWPEWYAAYMVAEQSGAELPT
jgi:catechol 2,3-dioxygenase-like lactoylglutathione lyase family enzyme